MLSSVDQTDSSVDQKAMPVTTGTFVVGEMRPGYTKITVRGSD